MYLCHCLLPAPASLYNQTSSRAHTISLKVTLARDQARPKDGTKRSTWETVISPAKLAMAMETRPLPGYHIRNSYWSRPGCWDQNNKTAINTERGDLSVTHRQSHTHTHLLSLLCRATIRAISVHGWRYSMREQEGCQSITCYMFCTYTVYLYIFLNFMTQRDT